MNEMHRFVLLDDTYGDLIGDPLLDFRLSYRGPLRATQRDPKEGTALKVAHWKLKHDMRLAFHRQLSTIWNTQPTLVESKAQDTSVLNIDTLARTYSIPPWSFVPLVTPQLQMFCGLEITLLRLDHPGDSVWSGDVDNRVKTIIDALDVPTANGGYADIPLDPAVSPLFCLLATDKLLTSVSVETGRLLDAPTGVDQSWAEVTIHVRITPENVTLLNLGL